MSGRLFAEIELSEKKGQDFHFLCSPPFDQAIKAPNTLSFVNLPQAHVWHNVNAILYEIQKLKVAQKPIKLSLKILGLFNWNNILHTPRSH